MANKTAKRNDPSRPFFERQKGRVGVYVDAFSAEPLDPHAYGSERNFLMELTDKMNEHLTTVTLDLIKGGCEREKLLEGVIFEKLHQGNVYSCSFESSSAVGAMWKSYHPNDKLSAVFDHVLGTPALLAAIEAASVQIRVRLYEDEFDHCRDDMQAKVQREITFDGDREMLRMTKVYQKQLAEQMMLLREDFMKFESTLGDFTSKLKQNKPSKVQQFTTFAEFESHHQNIKERGIDTRSLGNYIRVRKVLKSILKEIDGQICHRLAQVHGAHETEKQKALKTKIKSVRETSERSLGDKANFGDVRHGDWVSKIVLREHKLFLGLISVVAVGVDSIIDIDQMLDEYVSGFTKYKV